MKRTKPALSAESFRYDGTQRFVIQDTPTLLEPFYTSEEDRSRQLDELTDRMDQLQNRMHADERYGMLVIFQAMDAGGKDSSIRHVFKGINPSRFRIAAFKKPSQEELAHDFLWRFWKELPERGTIGIFNRSYYEETLITRVHPDQLKEQSLPKEHLNDPDAVIDRRLEHIRCFESYLYHNGFRLAKFYLHVAKQEQGQRLISRLSDPKKQWKLSESDLKERQHWDDYLRAYESAINATATPDCPWYVIPSDDRQNQQLIIAKIMTELLEAVPARFPRRKEEEAEKLIKVVEKQDRLNSSR